MSTDNYDKMDASNMDGELDMFQTCPTSMSIFILPEFIVAFSEKAGTFLMQ